MHVTRLGLLDFRSYANVDVELHPGITCFVGLNGQGKTNLVEALVYTATGHSHRVAKDSPLIRFGAAQAVISVRVRWEDREQTVEVEINDGRPNRARLAGAPRRTRDTLGVVRVVLFAPEDLALVKGEPGVRRRFLDEVVVALQPRMAGVLNDFERTIRQRNALLKAWHRSPDNAMLGVWNDQLADLGAAVGHARVKAVEQLLDPLIEAYASVAPAGAKPRMSYESSWWSPDLETVADYRQALLEALEHKRGAEIERGQTLVGPQRDDCHLSIGDLPAKGYASHGESWSLALALRLATFHLLRQSFDSGGDPVLILDDVFAELDAERRFRLGQLVSEAEQVLVTAAVPEDVPESLRGRALYVTRDDFSRVHDDR